MNPVACQRRPIRGGARGFTMIEIMLATSLGTLLVFSVITLMGVMDRTDTITTRRYNETETMSRLHIIMERTFSDFLIVNEISTTPTVSGRSTARPDAEREGARNGQAEVPPRPRIVLGVDASDGLKAAMRNYGLSGTPQRFEVVTGRAPVPVGYGRSTTEQVQAAIDAQTGYSVRGVFELRPDRATPAAALRPGEVVKPDSQGWTLWWRPLPATEGLHAPDPYTMEPSEDPLAIRVATGLAECKWTAFKTVLDPTTNKPKGREKLEVLEASQISDLPAYFEMLATTESGISANWMFEVGWDFGPETMEEADQEQQGQSNAQTGGGGGTTRGGGSGAGGGRQRGGNGGQVPGGGRGGGGGGRNDGQMGGPK